MRALDIKLFRDLWSMKGQALAIVLILGSGVATYVTALSTLYSLRETRTYFYDEYRFAQVFGRVRRAPDSLKSVIAAIPGVETVETRVSSGIRMNVRGFVEPVSGRLVAIPDDGQPSLNKLHLRNGRLPAYGRSDEVVISEAFATAHNLVPGETLDAILHGRKKTLKIVGIGLSPEFIFQLSPGAMMPDFKRYAILWMGKTPVSTAYDMEGAFNDVSLTLSPGVKTADIIDTLNTLLKPYGGFGSYDRENQISHRYLSEEMRQLATMATLFPAIFLSVAAFLLNVVMKRLIGIQREEISILKAFGYTNLDVAVHYFKLVILIVTVGSIIGITAGYLLGHSLSNLYMRFYHFPFLHYSVTPGVAMGGVIVSALAAAVGTLFAVLKAAKLPPAEGMRPEPPPVFRETLVERFGLKKFFYQTTRMMLRNVERRPFKALFSICGIALGCAIVIMGNFFGDSVETMVDLQFNVTQREDIFVRFIDTQPLSAVYEISSIEGVRNVEPLRTVGVNITFGHVSRRTMVRGIRNDGDLLRALDQNAKPIKLPDTGIVITDYLGSRLGVRPGDIITVELLEGSRRIVEVPVAGFTKQYMGVAAYMELNALNRLLGEGSTITGVSVSVDTEKQQDVYDKLMQAPAIAGITLRKEALRTFYETMANNALWFTTINTVFAVIIAFGVVYNTARISFAERAREMASLRVLGFTKGEISYILLSELALLTLLAIPVGFVFGIQLCKGMSKSLATELFRVPLVIDASTYAFAATVVLVSAFFSGVIVYRKIDTLDMIAVLKAED